MFNFLKERNRDKNIFRTISKKDSCCDLNKIIGPRFYPNVCFYKDDDKYLIKYFKNHDLYTYELYIYNELKRYNIVPTFFDYGKSHYTNMSAIALDMSGMISLRNVLCSSKKIDKYVLITKLFSFIYTLRDYGIIHNNLTIDSIYMKNEFGSKFDFYIIEFADVKIKKYMDDTNTTITADEFNIDICSLYLSIEELEQKSDIINYMKCLMSKYYKLNNYDFVNTITDYYT